MASWRRAADIFDRSQRASFVEQLVTHDVAHRSARPSMNTVSSRDSPCHSMRDFDARPRFTFANSRPSVCISKDVSMDRALMTKVRVNMNDDSRCRFVQRRLQRVISPCSELADRSSVHSPEKSARSFPDADARTRVSADSSSNIVRMSTSLERVGLLYLLRIYMSSGRVSSERPMRRERDVAGAVERPHASVPGAPGVHSSPVKLTRVQQSCVARRRVSRHLLYANSTISATTSADGLDCHSNFPKR